MEMVKIQIRNKAQSSKAFEALIRQGRIDCYRNDVYVVPETALEVLQELGIVFRELERSHKQDEDTSSESSPGTASEGSAMLPR